MMSSVESDLEQFLGHWRKAVEATLSGELPPGDTRPAVIHEAMRYSTLAGGKRIRPLLAVAAAAAVGADPAPLLKPFCALELIHTYSLVHDDLPALDNDDLRRGRATSHVVFGEAFAILAGDALLTEAFSWLSEPLASSSGERQLRAVHLVSRAIDSKGMIGGQVADIESERLQDGAHSPSALAGTLEFIHRNKTGRLLTASVLLGGVLGGATEGELLALESYGDSVGLAFQIVDDLLDVEETAETLGKTAGKDVAQGKLTYPALWGAERARQEVESLLSTALVSADIIGGPRNYLGGIARYLCARRS